MLELKNITKLYQAGDQTVQALRGVSLNFRKSEFVCILGPSGCGKTTLLNIIGGLDQYSSGDLVIDGRSTRDYSDGDWDVYRNRSIGFVFQNYNLIPHQSVLANVELALTLSGVGKAERRRRAAAALEQVGLADQLYKRPNQLSGGQMQRVAIARALVNNPEILLADEPTGALDSETSLQIMDLLREVARDRLVIMVTHNPDLAERYATRIVRLLDGQVSGDSFPCDETQEPRPGKKLRKKPMGQSTALSLSARNLMTKKGRTFLTAFAGSIGIIGIALILSLSNGIQRYIDQVQAETLSSYPITIEAEQVDMSAMVSSLMGVRNPDADEAEARDPDRVYSSAVMYELLNSMVNAEVQTNNLAAFKEFLDAGGDGIADLATIRYGYNFPFRFYVEDTGGKIIRSDVTSLMQGAMSSLYGGDYSSYFDTMGAMYARMDVWSELLPGEGAPVSEQVKSQYDLLYGAWPEEPDELILFVDRDNRISDLVLATMGLISSDEMEQSLHALMNGEESDAGATRSWRYDELCETVFQLILPAECYQSDGKGGYTDLSATETGLRYLCTDPDIGLTLRIVGVARPNEDASNNGVSGTLGYLSSLTDYAIAATAQSEPVLAQQADPETDVLTGLPFRPENAAEPSREELAEAAQTYASGLSDEEKAALYLELMSQPSQDYVDSAVQSQLAQVERASLEQMILSQYAGEMGMDENRVAAYIAAMDDETLFAAVGEAMAEQVKEQYAALVAAELAVLTPEQMAAALDASFTGTEQIRPLTMEQLQWLQDNVLPARYSDSDCDGVLSELGYTDPARPSSISLYAATFEAKDEISKRIEVYNEGVTEEDQITYTDYVALLMRSITTIINAISYVLIAFVAISLVVSSIMIGIITYISVLERTKEIGILRAIGASKKDVARVFNAETLIVGLAAGLIGIGMTLLLCIPLNVLVRHLTHIRSLGAKLPPLAAVALVLISMLLTLIAGIIPSRLASRKDPVTALRTE